MDDHTVKGNNEQPSDPLLECLVLLTQFYRRPYSAESLRSGLPVVNEPLTLDLFLRATEQIGMKARVVQRELSDISPLVLPVILLLKNKQACILYKINSDQTAEVRFPGVEEKNITASFSEIENHYTGEAIYLKPTYSFSEEKEEGKHVNNSSWFWDTLLQYKEAYIKVFIAAFLVNIFALLGPLYIMNIYDRVVSQRVIVTLWVLTIGILVVYLFDFILRLLRGYVVDVIGRKADVTMASNLFQKVLNLQLSHKPASVGYFASSLREFEVLRDFFSSATLITFIDFPFIILYLILTAYIGGKVVLVPLVAIPVVLFVTFIFNKPIQVLMDQVVKNSSRRHAVLVETVGSLEVLKSLVAEGLMQRKWEQHVGEGARVSLRMRFLSSIVSNISLLAQQCLTIGVIVVGVFEIFSNQLTLGGLIACSILSGRIMAPLGQMVGLLSRYQQSKSALISLNKLMALPNDRTINKEYIKLPSIRGDIEFSKVSFRYPNQQTKAIDNVTFKITAGEHVAILGRVGSGKSTIQKLILGLYYPEEGTVYIDGIDMLQLDPIDIRRHIGYVPQDNILFTGTLRENILMGKPAADDAAVIQAAQLSGADRFIKEHPQGYHWVVGERGEGLSGGQRQSIAMARAFLSNAPILLLDEPTSAIDDSSELELIQNLTPFIQNKTLILVTHRISLLKLVTRMIVMQNGKIVIDGPRDEVLKRLQTPAPAKPT